MALLERAESRDRLGGRPVEERHGDPRVERPLGRAVPVHPETGAQPRLGRQPPSRLDLVAPQRRLRKVEVHGIVAPAQRPNRQPPEQRRVDLRVPVGDGGLAARALEPEEQPLAGDDVLERRTAQDRGQEVREEPLVESRPLDHLEGAGDVLPRQVLVRSVEEGVDPARVEGVESLVGEPGDVEAGLVRTEALGVAKTHHRYACDRSIPGGSVEENSPADAGPARRPVRVPIRARIPRRRAPSPRPSPSAPSPPLSNPNIQRRTPWTSKPPSWRSTPRRSGSSPDALLFFRMGDFFELFHEDAKVASAALGLTLTARDREKKIPMAGVPARAADGYLRRLVRQGLKVAICDQMEDPAQAKGLVDRAVVRLVTAGTLTEDAALDPSSSNYLLAVRSLEAPGVGLAWVDLSTGRFLVADVEPSAIVDEVARVGPAEILVPEGEEGDLARGAARQGQRARTSTRVPSWTFAAEAAGKTLRDHFGVASLVGFTLDRDPPSLGAAGAALEYLRTTQMTALSHVVRIERHDPGTVVLLDRSTRRRLDLVERTDGEQDRHAPRGARLDEDRRSGARLLREWILAPLRDPAAIRAAAGGGRGARRRTRSCGATPAPPSRPSVTSSASSPASGTNRANARDLARPRRRASTPCPTLRARCSALAYSTTLAGPRRPGRPASTTCATLARPGDRRRPAAHDQGRRALPRRLRRRPRRAARPLAHRARTGSRRYQAARGRAHGHLELEGRLQPRLRLLRSRSRSSTSSKVPPEYVRTPDARERRALRDRGAARRTRRRSSAPTSARRISSVRLFQGLRETVARADPGAAGARGAARRARRAPPSLAEVASAGGWVRPEILEDRTLELVDGRHPVVERHLAARRALRRERRRPRRRGPDRPHHGPEHGGQEHLHPAGGDPRAAGADGLVRPVQQGAGGRLRPASSRASAPRTTSPAASRRSWSR